MEIALKAEGISKRFSNVVANDGIDFRLAEGEIHALLGENGAGKTTLMRILYGLLQPDAGKITVRGRSCRLRSPHDAMRLGIGMVHQHFMLVPTMTAAENIVLGQEISWGPFLRPRTASRRIREVSQEFGIPIRPDDVVSQLSVGEQQRVEIVKALYRGVDILILDEPTAAITPPEADALFESLRSMRSRGKSIIFISHKLKEAMAICDRVTILRRGTVVGSMTRAEASQETIARLMVGREAAPPANSTQRPRRGGSAVLEVRNLIVRGDRKNRAVRDLRLDINAGEILGIAGVDGNGQSELAEAIAGLRPIETGSVALNGKELRSMSARRRMERGLRYVPADRNLRGTARELSVADNAVLRDYGLRPFSRYGIMNHRAIDAFAQRIVRDYDVRCGSHRAAARTLSGGNLQKLVLGRETSNTPRFLVVEHPTRGLDISAIEHVHDLLRRKAAEGTAILLISADLDELLSLSNRIAVMYEGRLLYESPTADIDLARLGLAMTGLHDRGGSPCAVD